MAAVPPPPLIPGAAHDLLNAPANIPAYDIGQLPGFILSGDVRDRYVMIGHSKLVPNMLVAALAVNIDGTSSINAVGQVTMVENESMVLHLVAGNQHFGLSYKAPISNGLLFAAMNLVGLEWAKQNAGLGHVFNFKNGDAAVLIAASNLPPARVVSELGSSSHATALAHAEAKVSKEDLQRTLFQNALRFGELVAEGCPVGRQCVDRVIASLPHDFPLHGKMGLWPNVLLKFLFLEVSSTGQNIYVPASSTAKVDGQVGLLWLSESFDILLPVTHQMVKKSLQNYMIILDAACGPEALDISGRGYYDILSFQFLSFFDDSRSQNVYSMSPVFVANITQRLAAELKWKTRAVAGLPVSERELKTALVAVFAKYSFHYISQQHTIWVSQYPIDHQEFVVLMSSNAEVRSHIKRDTSLVLQSPAVAGGGALPAGGGGPPSKKPKLKKTATPVAALPAAITPVAQSFASGAGSSTSSGGVPGRLNWKQSCKYHLKHLFLPGYADCVKGLACNMFHQRKLKTVSKANLLTFLNDNCTSDKDYKALFDSITLNA